MASAVNIGRPSASWPSFFSRSPTDVRIAAYRALHHIGTPHAKRLLNQAVDDKDPEVKASARELLGMR